MIRPSLFSLFAAMLLVAPSTSNATVFGTLKCVVHDPQHRPIAGATVALKASGSEWRREAATDANGETEFTAVPVGDYTVEVSQPGFVTEQATVTVVSTSAPVLHVQLQLAALSQSVTVSARPDSATSMSTTPTTLVDRTEILATPGASRANGIEMVTAFVPGSYTTHDQLHVRGGHQVTWLVDGVPVPNTNIASNVGPQLDPKDADYVEAQRGSYGAEYGDRTYAAFNVVPRTGFERDNDVEILLSAGNYFQTDDQVSAGGHTDRFAYYASVTGNRSNLGLQTPVAAILHDRQSGVGTFGSLIFNANPSNQLRLVASARRDVYQVPNDAAAQAAGAADVERESDAFVNLSWVRTLASGVLLTVSPFYHRNAANLEAGPSGFPLASTTRRASEYAGAQATIGATFGRHEVEGGFYGFHQRDDQQFAVAFADASRADISATERPSGGLSSVFAQDTFRPAAWLSLTAGVRRTDFSGTIAEHATTPRAGVSVRIPAVGWTARAFYGTYYQAPPLVTVSGPLLGFVTDADLALVPLHGEGDREFQVGLMVPIRGWTLDVDTFRTRARNYFDHNSVGNSNVFFPLTIDGALIRGTELTIRSPRAWKRAEVHLAYSNQIAEGIGGIDGGLTDFSAPASERFLLDHDQRHTLSAGASVRFSREVFAGGNLYYGSGFPDEGGPARLPAHTTLDAVIGRAFGDRASLSLTVLNLANRRVLIDNSPTFGGTHFNRPREVYAQARFRFHY